MKDDPMDDFVRLCNCASCGRELLGLSMVDWFEGLTKAQRRMVPPFVEGHVLGRPLCKGCLTAHGAGWGVVGG